MTHIPPFLRHAIIIFLAILIATLVFTGIHFLVFSLDTVCLQVGPSGKCSLSTYAFPPNIDVLLLGITLLFLASLIISALAARFTHTIVSSVIACFVASCFSAWYALNAFTNALKGLNYGDYTALEYFLNVRLSALGEVGAILLIVAASFLGGHLGKNNGDNDLQ